MTTRKHEDFCLILAGGLGKRFWPTSRREMPKQFLDLFGIKKSLLQQTYERYIKFIPKDHIYISTFKDFLPLIKEQLPEIDDLHLFVEPVQLNTAPATAMAIYTLHNICPEGNMIVTPSDHYIIDEDTFFKDLNKGLNFVERNPYILSMGIKPTNPNTEYGYIQKDDYIRKREDEIKEEDFAHVNSFTEKPNLNFAEMFVEDDSFLWNTGLFLLNLKKGMEYMKELVPNLVEANFDKYIEERNHKASNEETTEATYPMNMSLSLDLTLLDKKHDDVIVQTCHFGWADIGSWSSFQELARKDVDGNVYDRSNVILSGCKDNLIKLPTGKVAVINDLDGYIIDDEGDILVIYKNDEPQKIRKMMNETIFKLGKKYS